MKLIQKAVVAGILIAGLSASAAGAHHSGAMYDTGKLLTLTGTIKAFNWKNPHISIDVVANPSEGVAPGLWSIAGSSPGVMLRSGWSQSTLKPGDKITLEFNPLRDGGRGGNIRKAVTPDGKSLSWGF